MAKEKKVGPSLYPQKLCGGKAWYFESARYIEVIVPKDAPAFPGEIRRVRILSSQLAKSLERMGYTVTRRKS